MDSRQLEILTAVADVGSFSGAAKALKTVQSNVSSHVHKLEDELNVVLIDRATGVLTHEGKLVVARARRIANEFSAIVDDLASTGAEIQGTVKIGMIGTTGRWLVTPLLDAVRSRYPKMRVVMTEASTLLLIDQLIAGRLDLAVVNLPVDDPEVRTRLLFDEDLVLIAPARHPLASLAATGATVADLQGHQILIGPPGTSVRDEVDSAAHALGVTITPLAELDGMRLIALLATTGYAPAVLPASAVRVGLPGDFVRIRLAGLPRRTVAVAVRRRGMESTPARHMRDILVDVIRREATSQPGVHLRLA
jgi:DNA-binding transcriptional LysR family regulator